MQHGWLLNFTLKAQFIAMQWYGVFLSSWTLGGFKRRAFRVKGYFLFDNCSYHQLLRAHHSSCLYRPRCRAKVAAPSDKVF